MPSDMTTAAQALEVLMALADEYANQAANIDRYSHGGFVRAARSALVRDARSALALAVRQHIESTAAELEALRKDAERYRWLRERNRNGVSFRNVRGGRIAVYQYEGNPKRRSGEATVIRAEELDAAIDAALIQGGK